MTEWRLEVLRFARQEAIAARRWYRGRSRQAALRFVDQLELLLEDIRRQPHAGHPLELKGMYWRKVRRFPFVVYYLVLPPDRIRVIAIAQGQRRLGYWHRRLPKE